MKRDMLLQVSNADRRFSRCLFRIIAFRQILNKQLKIAYLRLK